MIFQLFNLTKMNPLEHLHPAQKFAYNYGSFMIFWSNFEMMMEVAIWRRSGLSAKDNCKSLTRLPAGPKKQKLSDLLNASNETDKVAVLDNVFDVAERNGWVHGHVLNPNGDFSKFTLLRVEKDGSGIIVSNKEIDLSQNPFEEFYTAYEKFETTFGLPASECDKYVIEIQNP